MDYWFNRALIELIQSIPPPIERKKGRKKEKGRRKKGKKPF
jgi:hypothetical protein